MATLSKYYEDVKFPKKKLLKKTSLYVSQGDVCKQMKANQKAVCPKTLVK